MLSHLPEVYQLIRGRPGSGEREERDTKKCGFQGKDFGRGANITHGRRVLLSLNRPTVFYKDEPMQKERI